MATTIGIAFSSLPDPAAALKEACVAVKGQTKLAKSDLALVFATPSHAALPPDVPQKILQPATLTGVVSPALVLDHGVEPRGVAVLSLTSDEIALGTALRELTSSRDDAESGLRLARELTGRLPVAQRQGAILFCGPAPVNHSKLIRGLQEGLGRAFPMAGPVNKGGLLFNAGFSKDALSGLIVGGQARFAASWRHGWQPIGKPRTVTAVRDNSILTIDDRPAVSVYEDFFAEALSARYRIDDIAKLYPLGLNTPVPKEYTLRVPVEFHADGSLTCLGEVREGARLHLMIGDKESCRSAARSAAFDVRSALQDRPPRLVFIFLSESRLKLYGRSAFQEVRQIKEILGMGIPVFGMYTDGEIGAAGPLRNTQNIRVHNAGALVVAIG